MTDEEKKFRELAQYVKTEIMGYDENQKLTKNMQLRLRGLKTGQFIANKEQASTITANYPYEVILLTFKYIKPRLNDILKTKEFATEEKKFNYILAIVNNNINLIYNKVKQIKEEKRRAEKIKVEDIPNYENKYIKQEENKLDKKLESFW